jgi:type I restriction enzyme S subunit
LLLRNFRSLNKEYAYWLLLNERENLVAQGNGSVFTNLKTEILKSHKVKIPKPNEQSAIASTLGALDDKIDLNRRMNETLEAMARAIFKDWFVDFGPTRAKAEGRPPYLAPDLWALFPDALDDDDKPVGWRTGTLQNLVELNPKEPLSKGSFAPYLEMAALPTSGSTPEPPIAREFTSGTRFRNGDTLLARITPCLENGKTAFVQILPSGVIGWGSTEFIVLRPISPVPKPYAYILARENSFRTHAIQSMTGTSGRQRVRNEALAEYPVFIPNNENTIWREFGSVIEPLFELIKVNGEKSQTLAQLRDMLLPKLMSGEIRLRDAEKIIENVA